MNPLACAARRAYYLGVPANSGNEAITLGNQALTRHPCDTGAIFSSAIPSMAGCARHLNRWSVPDSDCDNRARPAAILLSPDVGGLQSKSGVRIMAISQSSALPPVASAKRCNKCGEEKPLSDFSKDSANKDGLQRRCKACCSQEFKSWKAENLSVVRKKAVITQQRLSKGAKHPVDFMQSRGMLL